MSMAKAAELIRASASAHMAGFAGSMARAALGGVPDMT